MLNGIRDIFSIFFSNQAKDGVNWPHIPNYSNDI